MAAWRCSICLLFLCLTLRELLNHIHVSHAGSPNFQVACMVDGCPRIYRRYHSFYKHVITIHRDTYEAAAGRGDGQEIPAAGTQVVERIDEIATDANPEAVEENNVSMFHSLDMRYFTNYKKLLRSSENINFVSKGHLLCSNPFMIIW